MKDYPDKMTQPWGQHSRQAVGTGIWVIAAVIPKYLSQ